MNITENDDNHYNKNIVWGDYIITNYLGVILCSMLITSIIKQKKHDQNSVNVLIVGFLSACIMLSGTCGSQCLASLIYGSFYDGPMACWLEAFFHISSILCQFWCMAFLSLRNYSTIVSNVNVTIEKAVNVIVLLWCICLIVTFILSYVSSIYLMWGLFCFFGFTSIVIIWMIGSLVLSLIIMGYTNIYIWRTIKINEHRIRSRGLITTGDLNILVSTRFAKRAITSMFILLSCWIFAIVCVYYEYVEGKSREFSTVFLGVFGTLHSVIQPIYFFFVNPKYREFYIRKIYGDSSVSMITSSK